MTQRLRHNYRPGADLGDPDPDLDPFCTRLETRIGLGAQSESHLN
jgi:hypothetical protein